MVDEGDLEAAEAGPGPGFGFEVFDGCADFGGDGFGFHVEEFGLGGGGAGAGFLLVGGEERSVGFIGLGGGGGGGVDFEGCCGWGFDHGQGGYDAAIDVGDLASEKNDVSMWCLLGWF